MKSFLSYCTENNLPPLPVSFRKWRSLKLQESDWMMLPDTTTISTEWANYRQSLRDLPANASYQSSVQEPNFVPLDPNGE
tara:strand:- start:711 stop:950 length:240 start_codon:yes stop_codon:yes gene_type:complete